MKKIEWRFIENFCEAELFQKAYDLVESDKNLTTLSESEGGGFHLKIDAESDLNTEIDFSRKYIKRAHCDCGQSGKNLCIHLIAAIILYRRIKNNESSSFTKNNNASTLPSRISIQAILSQIPKEDLDRFLQRYARINKSFGQSLKLHFASKVQVASPEQKYHDLIKSMTRLVPLANGKLSKQSIQSLFWISEELLLQVDDLIATESPVEAFAICFELLNSFQAIYRKMDIYLGEFEKFWIQIHQKLKAIIELDMAPDSKQEIIHKLLHLFNDPAYPYLHSPHNIFEILFPSLDTRAKALLLESALKKQSRKEMNPIPLVSWIKTAMRSYDEKMLEAALQVNDENGKWLIAIDSLATNNKEFARKISKWLILRTKNESWKHRLMDKVWSLFPDDSDSVVYALGLLTFQPEEKYIQYLINKHISFEMIGLALKDSKHVKALPALINFYIETLQTDQAKKMIEDHLGLELLKSFTAKLFVKEESWLESQYKTVLQQYLHDHVGPIPASKIQNILSYLQLIRCRSLAEHLQKWLKKEFADHPTMIELL